MRIDLSLLPVKFDATTTARLPRKAVGIDLGTTNSVMAVGSWDPADPNVLQIQCIEVDQPTAELGDHIGTLVPSVIALNSGTLYVGEGAKRLAALGAARGMRRNRDFFFETKNEMGTDRRYPQAPEGFRTPGEVGGQVLKFMMAASNVAPDTTVVTVPASFQAAQRRETVAAAAHAGFDLLHSQLLDEPVAAFIDFVATNPSRVTVAPGSNCNLLVFDFGGGTCDIAILSLSRSSSGGLIVAPRSISRFHRLGGADIDAAIVYDVLIPQLLEQNGLAARTFGFAEKRNYLEPALRPIAEGLKVGLCQELARRASLGLSAAPDLRRQMPGRHEVFVNDKAYSVTSPVLTAEALDQVLRPFLDRNMLAPRSDEYRTARSIFAPLDDAIERSGLRDDEIDLCLMVGGSASVPQMTEALRQAFPRADVITYQDAITRKECVARGAAIAATFSALTGRRLITPICHDAIALLTQDGLRTMVQAGMALPLPADGDAELTGIVAPRTSAADDLPLRVEVVAASDSRSLFQAIWTLQAPVKAGEPLVVRYRIDADQVLHLRLQRPGNAQQPEAQLRIENPLTNVQNPILKEIEAERLERSIASGTLTPGQRDQAAKELVPLLDELGQWEKALAVLRGLQGAQRGPDSGLLNWMGLIVEKLGDNDEACRLFEQAAAADDEWTGPLFNLALNLRRQRKTQDAIRAIDRAIERQHTGPNLTLRAFLAVDTKDTAGRQRYLDAAAELWPAPRAMSEWMLVWYGMWAREIGDDDAANAATDERRRRKSQAGGRRDEGELPAATEPGR
jgi:molecular chaperone DnaK